MDWKDFFRPTWKKIILVIVLIILGIFLGLPAKTIFGYNTCDSLILCFLDTLSKVILFPLTEVNKFLPFVSHKNPFLLSVKNISILVLQLIYSYLIACLISYVKIKKPQALKTTTN